MGVTLQFTKNWLDQDVVVTVTERGTFEAQIGDQPLYDKTLDGLEEKVRRRLKAVKIEHRIAVVLGPATRGIDGYQRAILRGRNIKTGAGLFTVNDEKMQIEHPDIDFLGAEITDEQIAEANRLLEIEHAASQARYKYVYALESEARQTRNHDISLNVRGLIEAAEKAILDAKPAS